MPDEISVRQWQELYRTRAFARDNGDAWKTAGWDDFYDPLGDRKVQALAKLVLGITHPFILDEYCAYFVEHQPGRESRYGSVCFHPLTEKRNERIFSVDLDCPFNREKWGLCTRRYGEGAPEFECGNIRRMLRYIHRMAHELEHSIDPPFWEEKKAAEQFVFEYGCYISGAMRREGEHGYSYWDRRTGSRKIIFVVHRLKDIPQGSQSFESREINGLYVYCPEDAGISLPSQQPAIGKSQKRKGMER